MERKPEESFEDYKVRRTASNQAVKQINILTKGGGTKNTRESRANKGGFAEALRQHFARMMAMAKNGK